jgi:UDP-N-acetylmuramoyl-tripeptide--D-alanyl-D-alanine ligase
MRPRSLPELAAEVGGVLEVREGSRSALRVGGVAIDSRKVGAGDAFVALLGEHVDGHDFVSDAFEAGAAVAVVAADREIVAAGPLIRVVDPGRGLLDLAASERARLGAVVIGITGSTGKTCTKDFTAAVLGTGMRTVASPASFNNEIGLPLTVLSAAADTEALVLEMGARGPGQIRLLCRVARPTIGVVTNVGVAHMELFGSAGAIREAKAELPESLPAEGTAVLNADDAVVRGFTERTRARVVSFGISPGSVVLADRVSVDRRSGRVSFLLRTPDGDAPVTLPVPGEHMVPNALAAAAVGHVLGLSPVTIADGLAAAEISGGRMELFETVDGLRVIDDSYNANPTSMAAALRTARSMASTGRCLVVLGGMAELGPIAGPEHDRIGQLLARLGVDRVFAVGDGALSIASAAEREGVEPERIVRCATVEDAVAALRRDAVPGDLVLIKASRVAGLERVARALAGDGPAFARGGGVAA